MSLFKVFSILPVVMGLVVAGAAPSNASVSHNRAKRLEDIRRTLGLTYPYEVVPNPPAADGGGVNGGFIWDAGRTIKFALEGGMRVRAPDSETEERHLYLGASNVCADSQKLAIGSAEESAVREVFRFFCEDNLPTDSLVVLIRDDSKPYRDRQLIMWSLPEQQIDALRIQTLLRFLDEQAARVAE